MTGTSIDIRRTLFATFGALFVGTFALSVAVAPIAAPLTAQRAL